MFRSRSIHRRSRREDRGFSLIEVMVSLGILVLVTAAIYPQVVAGLRAAGTARDLTQAKGVAQARLEQMRSMPFYVGREAGDFIDILDTYYRNTAPPSTAASCSGTTLSALPATSWTGYVPGSAPRCSWEPTGPLYRKVINPIESPGLGAFSMVVSTQFLAGSEPPVVVAPRAGYDSQVAGSDRPSSMQVGVTIAVAYRTHGGVRLTSTYSQIERSSPMAPLIESSAKVTTVHVSSAARTWTDWMEGAEDPVESNYDQPNLLANVGVIDLSGELFTGSRVIASATGAAASTSLPSSVSGAATNLVAPPDAAVTGDTASDVQLPNGCRWICFGATRTDQVSALASEGLPNAGTPTSPVRALIPAEANRHGFWFDNGKWRNPQRLAVGQPMISLDTGSGSGTMPGVRNCVVGGSGAINVNSHLTATGYLTSTPTADPSREVGACGTGQANTIRVFPTSFAPAGVVQISLESVTAQCSVRIGGTNTAASGYRAVVRYWNGSGYTSAGTVLPGNTSDPLAAVDLSQVVDPGSGLRLSDYIESWSSLLGADVTRTNTAQTTSVNIPAVVTLITKPTRSFLSGWAATNNVDPTSAISVSVGAASCRSSDKR